MRTRALTILALLASTLPARAAVTQSFASLSDSTVYAVTFYWVADNAGNVAITPAALLAPVQGYRLISVTTAPGSPAPTNNYSIALLDQISADMMSGAMAGNVSSSATQQFAPPAGTPPINGTFNLKITGNSVAGAQGTVVVYFGKITFISSTPGATGAVGPAGPAASVTASAVATGVFVADSGSANAYAGCPATSTPLQDGLVIELHVTHTNTASSTLSYCSGGVLLIVDQAGTALTAGALTAGSGGYYLLRYSSSATNWQIFGNCPSAGTGILVSGCQVSPDTSILTTKAALQTGAPLTITTTSASPTVYTGTMSPTLLTLTKDQVLTWDVGATACTGGVATSINIDTLGAKSLFQADGSTNPSTTDCTANRIVRIAYDGAAFRIVGGGQIGTPGAVTHTPGPLTLGLPVIGNSAGDVGVGTRSGNTTKYVTATGVQTSGVCQEMDANGNLRDAVSGLACGAGGGGGATSFSGLLDFNASNASATVQNIGALCTSLLPCQVRNNYVGSAVMTSAATATLSGTSVGGSNLAYWYWSPLLVLTVGHNSASTLTCNGNCTVATGVTGFPVDSIPLWVTTFTSLAWNTIVPATMDKRASMAGYPVKAGPGNSEATDPTTGVKTISTDATVTPRYFSGSGAPAINCTTARDTYTDTTGLDLYFCDATNTWKKANANVEVTTIQSCGMISGPSAYPQIQQFAGTITFGPLGGSYPNTCAALLAAGSGAQFRLYYWLHSTFSAVGIKFAVENPSNSAVANTFGVKTACAGNGGVILSPTLSGSTSVALTTNASANNITINGIASLAPGCSGSDLLIIDVTKTDALAAVNLLFTQIIETY